MVSATKRFSNQLICEQNDTRGIWTNRFRKKVRSKGLTLGENVTHNLKQIRVLNNVVVLAMNCAKLQTFFKIESMNQLQQETTRKKLLGFSPRVLLHLKACAYSTFFKFLEFLAKASDRS